MYRYPPSGQVEGPRKQCVQTGIDMQAYESSRGRRSMVGEVKEMNLKRAK